MPADRRVAHQGVDADGRAPARERSHTSCSEPPTGRRPNACAGGLRGGSRAEHVTRAAGAVAAMDARGPVPAGGTKPREGRAFQPDAESGEVVGGFQTGQEIAFPLGWRGVLSIAGSSSSRLPDERTRGRCARCGSRRRPNSSPPSPPRTPASPACWAHGPGERTGPGWRCRRRAPSEADHLLRQVGGATRSDDRLIGRALLAHHPARHSHVRRPAERLLTADSLTAVRIGVGAVLPLADRHCPFRPIASGRRG